MNRLTKLFASAVICALPLVAGAQTATPMDKSSTGKVLAPDQPRSESERKATTENGQAPKYGQTEPSAADTMDKSDTSKSNMKAKRTSKVNSHRRRNTAPISPLSARPCQSRGTCASTTRATVPE